VRDAPRIKPRVKVTLRALGFGRRSPAFVAVAGGGGCPEAAWLSPRELRRLVDAGRKILK